MPYSLIEYKLRRYLYLGHEYSIYVPPSLRTSFWPRRYHDDVIGVQIIGKIIIKNEVEDINSIVPIILKIKKEDTLYDDRLLIFTLAVCTRFNLESCRKMVTDAYAAVSSICTDGLKLLMFVKFCNDAKSILHEEGYLPNVPSGFGHGFRKTMIKWYLNKDPLLTTEQIIKHRSYNGWSHKDVMKLIHIRPTHPSCQMFVTYTFNGMKKVEELFGSKLKDIQIKNVNDTFENKQLKFIYNFLNQVHNIQKMDENTLLKEIERHRWGHSYEIIPKNMLKRTKILTSLVTHMPLRELLDNLFFFSKQRLFHNSTPDLGLWEFILRFNNTILLKKSRIHPIESFIEYVKYSRTKENIIILQNNIINKKQMNLKIEPLDNKLRTTVNIHYDNSNLSQTTIKNVNTLSKKEESTTESMVKNKSKLTQAKSSKSLKKNSKSSDQISKEIKSINKILNENNLESEDKIIQSEINNTDQNQLKCITLLKPPPKLENRLLTFLSEDLIQKTLENLESTGCRIMITYDSKMYLKETTCTHTRLLKVQEAITLIILSLIYPENLLNKPTICTMDKSRKQCYKKIKIDYKQTLTFSNLNSILFKSFVRRDSDSDKKKNSNINPTSIMNWARKHNEEYDVFVFLGTNTMSLKNTKQAIKKYQAFFKKSVKIIVCCLNGKHTEQTNLCRTNMLFISGFDKHVGKLIYSFINGEF